jgi:4-amino-4-deoxy-L-arabinose transferase-like glycosyltransferase
MLTIYFLPIILVLVAATAVAIGLAVWLALRLKRLERRYQVLTTGTTGGNLETVLEDHVRQLQQAIGRVQELDLLTMRLERSNRSHLQRVGFLRFNPFRDTGGDQSFALALTDEAGNGVVVSSLHSREVTRVYAKPLVAWQTSYQLTEEEQQAIRRAKGET